MLAIHKNLSLQTQQRRIRHRCEIEKFCEAIEELPVEKQILFRLYFRYGYSTGAIAKLCKVHETTIARRLKRIAKEVETVLSKKGVVL